MANEEPVDPMQVHLSSKTVVPSEIVTEAPARRTIILLADDNEDTRMAVSEFLAMKGYEVVTVADGRAALARIRETRPDLVLMDIQMPGMNGLEAMQQLRGDPEFHSLIILALTAMGMPGDREMCLSAGADDQLLKPIRLRSLVETIEAWLAGRTGPRQAG